MIKLEGSGQIVAVNTFGANGLVSRWASSYPWRGQWNGSQWVLEYQANVSVFYLFDEQGNTVQRYLSNGTPLRSLRHQGGGGSGVYDVHLGGKTHNVGWEDPYATRRGQFGYYDDEETLLTLCTYRYLDGVEMRWLTRDPLGYDGGINLYAYCNNNPIMGTDPLGLQRSRTDDLGIFILGWWGNGNGVPLDMFGENSNYIQRYMNSNRGLTQDLNEFEAIIRKDIKPGERKCFDVKVDDVIGRGVEMSPGGDGRAWDTTGAILLHGAHDVFARGIIYRSPDGRTFYQKIMYVWDDVIDANRKFDAPITPLLGGLLVGGNPTDFDITISWQRDRTFKLPKLNRK